MQAVMSSLMVHDNATPSHFTASPPQKSSSAPASMRPLTAAYQASSCAHEVRAQSHLTPHLHCEGLLPTPPLSTQ